MGKADVTTHGAAQYHLPKIFFFHLMNSALRALPIDNNNTGFALPNDVCQSR